MNKGWVSFLIFVLLSFSVYSINYAKFCFTDSSSNLPVNNIKLKGFICSDSQCNQPIGTLWNGMELTSTDNCITGNFPSTLQGQSYSLVAYIDSYKTKLMSDMKLTDGNNPGTSQTNPSNYPFNPIKMNKQASCSSPVSLSVVNNIRENLPVSVTSGANLDSTTSSAIGSNHKGYYPPELNYYYEVETTLRLKIYKYNSTTSKNMGSPIHTENIVKRIYYDDKVNVEFTDWMPPEQIDQFSYYNVTVESDVTDPKCSSKINQRASKILRVWRNDPRNQCYSLIDTNGLVFSPVDYPNKLPEVGQEVTITLRKLSNYANDFEPWDPLFTLTPQSTNINLRLKQRDFTDILITQTLPENPDANFKDVTFKWIPTKAGLFTMEVTADAATCPVSSDISSDAYIQQLTVFEKPSYKLKFIVKSEGNAVSGAKVIIANPILENLTTALGVTSFRLQRGIRSYKVEKSPYFAG